MEGADESTELWWHPLTFNELSTGFYFNGFQEYLGEFPDLLRAIFLSKITYPACLGVLATFWALLGYFVFQLLVTLDPNTIQR